ncbi:hypothetical protein KZJ38_11690 [Paraburkholderia edwinii]|uniref:Uncharacterized protein n=1 Tax=Paraburkholderia edwinii TaxID=2861782 RepID=A0ABX8UEQ9_9BURK|nr:hypothetical protein [Paraburkholderia edwinii]QYD67069.1 hypothetical protein KZJ38_11690 [Paraburkholderia edwinii]
MLSLDYLKFLQLSVDVEFNREASFDDAALQEAMAAVRSGSMRAARPAMKVFFDGCHFWLASHFHRYEAARRLGARYQEFWCEIERGSMDHAVRYASTFAGWHQMRAFMWAVLDSNQ